MTTFNQEYIQSGDGNLSEPVHVGRPGQQVIFSNTTPAESYTARYPTIESVPDDFNGEVDIVTSTYRATVKGDGVNKYTVGFSTTDSARPSASSIGIGHWQVRDEVLYSDGESYSNKPGKMPVPIYANSAWNDWTLYGSSIAVNGTVVTVTSNSGTGNFAFGKIFALTAPVMMKIRMRVTAGTLTGYKAFVKKGTGAATTTYTTAGFVFPAINEWTDLYVLMDSPSVTSEIDIIKSPRAIGDQYEIDTFEVYDFDGYNGWAPAAHGLEGALSTPTFKTITVAPTGGNYTTITAALAGITDATATNQYNIDLFPGTYNEINVTTKDYVHIIGRSKANCIINGYQAPSTSNALIEANSTVDLATYSTLSNVTILGQNVRYAIHSDGTTTDKTLQLINCYVEHKGNAEARADRIANSQDPNLVFAGENALGCGSKSGQLMNIINSTIKATNNALAMHNNTNFSKASNVVCENTEFITTSEIGTAYLPNPGQALRVDSLGSTKKDSIRLINCKINGKIINGDQDGGWLGTPNPATHIEWDIQLSGSGVVQVETDTVIAADEHLRPVNFDTETNLINTSGGVLARGTILAYNTANSNIRAMLSTDTVDKFVGIALTDIADGAIGRVSKTGIEKDTFILADGAVTAALGTIYEVSSTTPGAFFVNAASTRAIARGVGANILKY